MLKLEPDFEVFKTRIPVKSPVNNSVKKTI